MTATDLRTELRDRAAPARDRVQDLSQQAKVRAQDLVVKVDPAGAAAAETIGDMVKTIVTGAAAVPLIAARLLIAGSRWADRLGEQGRTMASRVEPPRSVRRRRRANTAAWFLGGAALGFGAGWLARERVRREEQDLIAAEDDDDYGSEAAQLHERRQA